MDEYTVDGAGPGGRPTIDGLIAAAMVSLESSTPWTLIPRIRLMTRRIARHCDFG